ncbi:MAG: trimethylamine methyltransferase family protein [Rhodospirillales bacterium]|jgi:trimethylamine---corrinoid protein Co-methyltransferase|nr:trimethylamine methyltransferase family protein [Rhodospirillales bacterium]MBT4041242.1 trimethylamine methyltransferase family protein [Rhodospirillales bacterium]MBT4626471.1 trimethylamine methyltransferase family protein [Rhodospirillales bacterium]MBT5350348.1 trimethylamine methyltransferase family protein [Rhodospirillales bacterium]MBT6108816.1 trimethylamine methyltransferase family protein [Rhodospirillales bacterium]
MARRSSRRREPRATAAVPQTPWRRVINPRPPVEVLTSEQVGMIHDTSMRVLEEVGMRVDCPDTRALLKSHGNKVDEAKTHVWFDRKFVEERVAMAPSTFRVHTLNAERYLDYGGNNIIFASVGGPAFVNDLDKGRRPGTYAEYQDGLRILQSLNSCHFMNNGIFACMDQPANKRHLDTLFSCFTLMDKGMGASVLGRTRAQDAIDMACIAHGTDAAGIKERPVLVGNINTNSPLVLDTEMAQGAWTFAENGQPMIVTPFTLSGAMSPATVPGALVQQNAEALAGIAFLQTVNPGTPSIYGTFTSNVDMKTGSPAFGTPEYVQATLASAQLGRHYGLPVRASNTNASNVVDAQAAYESQMSLWACVLGHVNHINHAFGWLEGGLSASFEKFIVDAEMIQMLVESLTPMDISEETLGFGAIKEVGPGGHFFGAADTLSRYEKAFYEPMLSDWQNFENWEEAGKLTATDRANKIWKVLLEEYQAPAMDPAIRAELEAFVVRRKAEIDATPV